MKSILILVFIFLVASVEAQQGRDTVTVKPKVFSYFGGIRTGTLIGCADCNTGKEVTFAASIINGITIGKRLRTGIVVGYNSYFDYKAAPVMGSLSFDLLGKKHRAFIQGSAGRAWARNSSGEENYGYKDSSGGLVYSAGIGYRLRYHDLSIGMSVDYQVQHVSSTYEYTVYYETFNFLPAPASRITINENLKRVSLSVYIGWH